MKCKIIVLLITMVGFLSCKSGQEKGITGTYHNLKNDIKLTIKETNGWGGIEYILTELKTNKLGRFDGYDYKMTVFKDIRPDHFAYKLKFSEDYKFVFREDTGELIYVKKYYFNKLSAKEKEALKTKKLQ
ncbi:hypothetical protein EGM88_08375 [Aureibaculum marinum]|uniref:Lipoprotein n=1 Tax=Aureibaculum marinum TaxID=2487930 RepID=A0A3N4NPI2_9FLAO|nr:hypothetical protein [Aureibaculum marinum]RPD97495.1 hypothetical protein EGM88_08375 [Aureibaculum marinum]